MSMARVVITSNVVEGRSMSAVARDYGSREGRVQWFLQHYAEEGDAALEPRHGDRGRASTGPRSLSRPRCGRLLCL